MAELSPEQVALKNKIRMSAFIWADILGLIAGGITYFATSSMASGARIGVSFAVFAVVAGLIFMWRYKANSTSATCENCSATFSITRTDRAEKTLSSEPKETRDAQPDHSTKVVTWIEDQIEVTDTYTCAKCADTRTNQYTRTTKRDEKEEIEPAPIKDKPKAEPAKATSSKSNATKTDGSNDKPAPAEPGVTTSSKSGASKTDGSNDKPDDQDGFFSAAKEATPPKGTSKK